MQRTPTLNPLASVFQVDSQNKRLLTYLAQLRDGIKILYIPWKFILYFENGSFPGLAVHGIIFSCDVRQQQ